MKKVFLIFLLIATVGSLSSCLKEERELIIIDKEVQIDEFIEKNFADSIKVKNGGVNRIIIQESESSDTLAFGDSLSFYYSGSVFNNGSLALFATNNEFVAEAQKFEISDPDFSVKKILFQKDNLIKGLELGLTGVRPGEHSIILFSPRYGFYTDPVYNIPPLSSLLYEVWIMDVKKNN